MGLGCGLGLRLAPVDDLDDLGLGFRVSDFGLRVSTAHLDVARRALLQHDVLKPQVPVAHARPVRVTDGGAGLPHDQG